VEINLGRESCFYALDSRLFRGVFDERGDTVAAHTGERQLYTFAKSLYEADVYISLPTQTTHQKAGVTLNLKGLVGGITAKNQLVHWRVGSPETGGDEYPDAAGREAAQKAAVSHRGAHPGNDTIWRMVADLYKAMQKRERGYFSIIDGIIAGEGQGPFCPRAKSAKVLLGGNNLLAVDIAAARLMGFDPGKISYLRYFIETGAMALYDIEVMGKDANLFFRARDKYLDFAPPPLWHGIKVE
jgi:uncharacterized protein (DUF362 family)